MKYLNMASDWFMGLKPQLRLFIVAVAVVVAASLIFGGE